MKKFSLINPENSPETNPDFNKHLYSQVFTDLKVHRILQIKPTNVNGAVITYRLEDFLTGDIETITHRLDIFEDLVKCKGLFELLRDVALPAITNIASLSGTQDAQDYYFLNQLYSVKKLSVYVECIEKLHETLSGMSARSRGICGLAKEVAAIHKSDEFGNLKLNMSKISLQFKNIKSITVGINLGDNMNIDTIGIVSINEEPFRSGRLLDKLLSADFSKKDEYSFITPLEPIFKSLDTAQKFEANRAFKSAFDTLLRRALRDVPRDVSKYMGAETQFLTNLLPELCFLVAGFEMMARLKEQGMTTCKPKVSETKETYLTQLYHPILLESIRPVEIKRNSVTFDENGMFYVLSGANSGGKSVFLHSIGLAQILFQLGLYIPASEACMLPVDSLYLHQSSESTIQNAAGRLEHECIALNKLIKTITPKSMVLVDEAFSSTSAYDGSLLAEELLKHFAALGCRGVFSTHIHDMPIERINAYGKATIKLDTLVATSIDGVRTHRIERQKPEGLSHAKDIAKRYGLLLTEESS